MRIWFVSGLLTLGICLLGQRWWPSIEHTRIPPFATAQTRGLAVLGWILSYMFIWTIFYQLAHPLFTHITSLLTTEITHLIAIPWLILFGAGCIFPIIAILFVPSILQFYRLVSQRLHHSRVHQQQAPSQTETDLGNRLITLIETHDIEPQPRIIEKTDQRSPPNISAGRSFDGTPTLIVNAPQENMSGNTGIQLTEPSLLAILYHEIYHLRYYHSVVQLILMLLTPLLGGKSAIYTLFDQPAMEWEADRHAEKKAETPPEATEHPLANALQQFDRLQRHWQIKTLLTTDDEANSSICGVTLKLPDFYRVTVLLLWHTDRADLLRPSVEDRMKAIRDR